MHYGVKINGAWIRTHDLWVRKRVCYPPQHSASRTAVCLLDLPAVFVTIDYSMLISRLSSCFVLEELYLAAFNLISHLVILLSTSTFISQLHFHFINVYLKAPLLLILCTALLSALISDTSVKHHLHDIL